VSLMCQIVGIRSRALSPAGSIDQEGSEYRFAQLAQACPHGLSTQSRYDLVT